MSPRLVVVLATLSLVLWACSRGGGAAPGHEGSDCYPNRTCDPGLTCFSNLCVRYDGGVGADKDGGAAGAPATGSAGAGAAGTTSPAGAAGTIAATGAAGATGTAGTSGKAGSSGAAGGGAGTTGTAGTAGGAGTTGAAGVAAPPAPRSCVGAPECFVPETLVPATTPCDGVRFAIEASWLLWTNKAAGTVNKVNTLTHEIGNLGVNQSAPTQIMANDSYGITGYYVVGGDELRETRAGSAQGLPAKGYGAIGGLTHLAAAAPNIYFSAGLGIYRNGQYMAAGIGAEETGVPAAIVISPVGDVIAILTKDGNVDVIPAYPYDATPARCATDVASATNHTCTRVAANQPRLLLDEVYLFGGQVYWASGASIYRASAYAASGSLSPVATTAHGGDVTSFFVDGSPVIYLAEDGFIERARLGDTVKAIPIAENQPRPTSVHADGSHVFWTRPDCAIENVEHD